MKTAILIPAYNNASTLGKVIGLIRHVAKWSFPKDKFYILVANDGSTDDTDKVLQYILGLINQEGSNIKLNADSWAINEGVGSITKKGLEALS